MANAKITILSDKMRGTSFVLTNDEYSIGRSDSADICIQEPTISGHHCTLIKVGENEYAVRDEGSTNGSRINGDKLEENADPITLHNGDLLQVGNIELLFENADSSRRESAKTLTVINLDDTGTVSLSQGTMANLSKKNSKIKHSRALRDNKKQNAIMFGIIAVIALAAIGALAFMVLSMKK
ncbi:MAG: FHA domain-containing protein [Victivallales bacterium]|nr:FHA domain-containing protein [Victivallales bacterium]